MKFQVRDGFVAKIVTRVDLGDDKFELQENTVYGGQKVELTAEQAELHAHKLEPIDKEATAWLAAKVRVEEPGTSLGLSEQQLALVQTLAAEMAKQIVAQVQAPAKAA